MIAAIAMVLTVGVASANSDEASRLWNEGRELADAGKYVEACAKFTRSFELDARPGYEANLADCHEHLKHMRKAWQLFLDAAARWDNVDPEKASGARERAAAVARDATTVVIGVTDRGRAGLTVLLNGERLELAHRREIREVVDPGAIEIAVSAAGYRTFTRERTGRAGETVVIDVELEREEVPNRRRTFVRLAIGLGAGAIVSGGLGLLFAFEGSSKYDAAKTGPHCDGKSPPTCDAAGSAALADGQRLADFGTYLGIGAGVLAAAAITMYLVAPADVQIVPTATASSAGVSAAWRF